MPVAKTGEEASLSGSNVTTIFALWAATRQVEEQNLEVLRLAL
jgi:hypothetical protein